MRLTGCLLPYETWLIDHGGLFVIRAVLCAQMGGGPSPVMANFGSMPSQGFMGLPSNSPPLAFNARPGLLAGPGPSMLGSFGVNQMQQLPQQQQAPQQAPPQQAAESRGSSKAGGPDAR